MKVWNALTHATIVLSVVFLVFFCIDQVNPMMEFIGSDLSDWLLCVFCVCALLSSIISAVFLFRAGKPLGTRRRAHLSPQEDGAQEER